MLVGASGLAREVIGLLQRNVVQLRGVVDDDASLTGKKVAGVTVLGVPSVLASMPNVKVLICVGGGQARERIVDRLQEEGVGSERYLTLIDSSVRVPAGCAIGVGSIVFAGVVITADVTVGRHVVLMPNVTLTHDDVVEDFATLCAGVSLGGQVRVGSAAYLGMNAGVRENTRVGARSTLGMGSVLLRSLPDGEIWAGVPAQQLSRTAT